MARLVGAPLAAPAGAGDAGAASHHEDQYPSVVGARVRLGADRVVTGGERLRSTAPVIRDASDVACVLRRVALPVLAVESAPPVFPTMHHGR